LKRRGPPFYLSKHTFYGVFKPVDPDSIPESPFSECGFEISGVTDEKHGAGDVVFLDQLGETLMIRTEYVEESRT